MINDTLRNEMGSFVTIIMMLSSIYIMIIPLLGKRIMYFISFLISF